MELKFFLFEIFIYIFLIYKHLKNIINISVAGRIIGLEFNHKGYLCFVKGNSINFEHTFKKSETLIYGLSGRFI